MDLKIKEGNNHYNLENWGITEIEDYFIEICAICIQEQACLMVDVHNYMHNYHHVQLSHYPLLLFSTHNSGKGKI